MTEEQSKYIIEVINKHGAKTHELINILNKIQNKYGYISSEAQSLIAEHTNTNKSQIYGMISFYPHLRLSPKPKTEIKVCCSSVCKNRGASKLTNQINNLINNYEKSSEIEIKKTGCVGLCGLAPVVFINDEMIDNADISKIKKILSKEHF